MSVRDLRFAFPAITERAGAPHPSPLMDVREAAAYIGRTPNFVRRVLRYEIPVVQRGRRGPLFFYKHDVDLWLASNRQDCR